MGVAQSGPRRRQAQGVPKRELILEAARRVFEREGLDGASLRAIAAEADYTPAALYFHFESKEALYAEILHASLARLGAAVTDAVTRASTPEARLRAASLAFFRFYAESPRDLELGFYLFRGGLKPRGLGRSHDVALNRALAAALQPVSDAAVALGAQPAAARDLIVDVFAHAAGLLLLAHTGRIRMFAVSVTERMEAFIDLKLRELMET